jgi:hypothetical protein
MLRHYTIRGKSPPDVFSGDVPVKIREICKSIWVKEGALGFYKCLPLVAFKNLVTYFLVAVLKK